MKTITNKTIAQCIREGIIKVGTELQVDRNVACNWHERTKVTEIWDDFHYDGIFVVWHTANGKKGCNCENAQHAQGLTITIFDDAELVKVAEEKLAEEEKAK